MPKYRVLKRTLVAHTGRVHDVGEEIEIDWPTDSKGASLAPTRLGENLEIVVPADEEQPGRRRRTSADA